jgi:predicted TIM-barrel fold metal-dependent hydrolase
LNFGVIDIHCHIFPPLHEACGFPDAATHLLHQQRSIHVHGNQPYRRQSDHGRVTERPLWDPSDHSENGRNTTVNFRVGGYGQFAWTVDGEEQYVQFLPPSMKDMSAPADTMIRQMDYAGIEIAVLQNEHIYGNLAEEFTRARSKFPGRFIGLAQVEEGFADRDEELKRVGDQLDRLDMAGLYYTTTGLFRDGYRRMPDDPSFDPLWAEMERRDVPVFWVHSAQSPVGTYEDELRHLARIVERHPRLRHVLVHGVPTGLYADDAGRLNLPDILSTLLREAPVSAEILYPIGWGGRIDYPYAEVHPHVRRLLDQFGCDRFMWGSDMPNVERFCTYRQSLTYLTSRPGLLSEQETRSIFRDNAVQLFKSDRT